VVHGRHGPDLHQRAGPGWSSAMRTSSRRRCASASRWPGAGSPALARAPAPDRRRERALHAALEAACASRRAGVCVRYRPERAYPRNLALEF
jgi:hypothetical protein